VKRAIGKLIASLVLTAPLGLVGLMPASAASQVPFRGQFAGSFTLPDQTDILLAGTGTASSLGQATSSGHIRIVGPSTCANGFAVQDTETLTATDDGSTITFSVTSQACPTATPGVYEIQTPYTVPVAPVGLPAQPATELRIALVTSTMTPFTSPCRELSCSQRAADRRRRRQ
jgi:hypothetical protein